jgi:uncharacterized membrane protein YczE
MERKRMARRIIQYALGLVSMGLGIVFLKRANLGITPITSIPAAVSEITPFTLGNVTIALHVLCVIGQIILLRRVTLKSLLTIVVGFVFGYIVDGLMLLIPDRALFRNLLVRCVMLLAGTVCNGLGVALIVGSDLMLPAPDEMTHTIAQVYGKKLANVKIISDACYVAVAVVIDLLATGRVYTVGIGTVVSVLLTGRFIGLFTKIIPGITLPPFWKRPARSGEQEN